MTITIDDFVVGRERFRKSSWPEIIPVNIPYGRTQVALSVEELLTQIHVIEKSDGGWMDSTSNVYLTLQVSGIDKHRLTEEESAACQAAGLENVNAEHVAKAKAIADEQEHLAASIVSIRERIAELRQPLEPAPRAPGQSALSAERKHAIVVKERQDDLAAAESDLLLAEADKADKQEALKELTKEWFSAAIHARNKWYKKRLSELEKEEQGLLAKVPEKVLHALAVVRYRREVAETMEAGPATNTYYFDILGDDPTIKLAVSA